MKQNYHPSYHPIISNTGYWSCKNNEKIIHACSVPLCNWIINFLSNYKDTPLYDFGCGVGQYSKRFFDAGFKKVTGFEGAIPANRDFDNIRQQDLTKPFTVNNRGNCVFLEVAEHIPEQYEDIVIDNVTNACSDKLIMSWAIRGQSGHGHVNCLNNDEVIDRLNKRNFSFLKEESEQARSLYLDDLPWFKNTIMIFERNNK